MSEILKFETGRYYNIHCIDREDEIGYRIKIGGTHDGIHRGDMIINDRVFVRDSLINLSDATYRSSDLSEQQWNRIYTRLNL